MKPTVNFVDAGTGSGKTFHTIRHIASTPASEKFIIGTPNTALSIEIAAKLAAKGVSVLQIDSSDGTHCSSALIGATIKGEVKVIIVNRDVVLGVDRSYFSDYHLILDEIPPIYNSETLDGIVISKSEIKTYFSTFPSRETPAFLDVHITQAGAEFLTKWRGEEVFKLDDEDGKTSLPKIVEKAWNANYRVVLSSDGYREFVDGDGKRLTFYNLVKPSMFSGFKSTTIIGANFKKSMLHLVYSDQIVFKPHPEITGFQIGHAHKADQTQVFYFSKRDCSKYLLSTIGFQTVFDAAAKAVETVLNGAAHIFTMNNPEMIKVKGKWAKQDPYKWAMEGKSGTRVSPDPNGRNDLQHIHNAVHLAALNWTTMDFHFFSDFFSIDPDEAIEAMTFERTYQMLSRTSFRDRNCAEKIKFFVFDQRSADWLSDLIGCKSAPTYLDLGIAALNHEKRTAADRTAAASAAKARWREKKAEELRLTAHEDTAQYDGFGSRVWGTDTDKAPSYEVLHYADVIELFRASTETDRKFKRECSEFREGSFGNLDNHLIADNLISSKMLALDVDKSHVSAAEFSRFLTELNLTHVIYNSFSNKGFPYSYHVLIPMNSAVVGDNYRHIFNVLKGYSLARFGKDFPLDSNFGSINKWIKMPCRSKFDADVFIEKYAWNDILTKDYRFLDVRDYLTRRVPKSEKADVAAPVDVAPCPSVNADEIVNDVAIRLATDGSRDNAFKVAGLELMNNNVPEFEAIRALDSARDKFGKKSDRGAARRLVKSLSSIRAKHAAIL